jgi:shikimate kinase
MLAPLLGGEFIDLDQRIEEETGKSPRALFKEGPDLFRRAEARALGGLFSAPETAPCRVIAAGGGLIDNPEAAALLSAEGGANGGTGVVVVYLEVSPETAWERIRRAAEESGELPPFLDTPNPRETHRRLHRRRGAAYRKAARFILSGEGKSPGALAEELLGLLKSSGILSGKAL